MDYCDGRSCCGGVRHSSLYFCHEGVAAMRGMTAEQLVIIILIIATAGVVLVLVLPAVVEELQESAGLGKCSLSMIWSAGLSQAAMGITDVAPECESDFLYVDKAMLDGLIDSWAVDDKLRGVYASGDLVYAQSYSGENAEYRFAFSKVLADSLNNCRLKVVADIDPRETLTFEFFKTTTCIICTRVAVAEEVVPLVYGSYDMEGFMKSFSPRTSPKSYYDLMKGASDFRAYGDQIEDAENVYLAPSEQTINNALADKQAIGVVYVYTPVGNEENIRFVRLFPYGELTTGQVVEWREYLIGGLNIIPEDKSRCGVLVG